MRITITLLLTKHACNTSDITCCFHRHHHIRSGVGFFVREDYIFSSSSSNVIFENFVNGLNNEASADLLETESC